MSRIGKKAVPVPAGVTVNVSGQTVSVKGPKGELKHVLADAMVAKLDKDKIAIEMREDTKEARAMWGMSRTQIANLIKGVTDGYSHDLEIHGVGFKASMKSKNEIVEMVGL